MWQKSIDSTLWDALKKRPTGSYRAVSFVDGIERQYIYKIVGDMPLVMLTGFSNKDVKSAVVKQIQPIVIVAIAFDIIIAMLALILTITYRQRDQMKKLSTIDALTGIFNRRYIQDFGCSEVARSKRYGRPVSLIMIDIDHFKMINDKWGHPTGDRVIQELTRAMLSVVRSQDVVGRLGGEEFLVILPETDQAGTKVIAERIHNFVQNDVMTIADNGSTIKFTVSLGTATLLDPQDSFDSLSSCADKGRYVNS
jgi:diguanylate cyclase (GGDEF)-like protein